MNEFYHHYQVPFSKQNIDVLTNKVHSVITKSYEAACLMRKSLRKKDSIWWNSELASLRKEACRPWRKAIKTKQEEDWKVQKLGLAYFKKAVRRAKRDSWHSFVESINSITPKVWLVKIIRICSMSYHRVASTQTIMQPGTM